MSNLSNTAVVGFLLATSMSKVGAHSAVHPSNLAKLFGSMHAPDYPWVLFFFVSVSVKGRKCRNWTNIFQFNQMYFNKNLKANSNVYWNRGLFYACPIQFIHLLGDTVKKRWKTKISGCDDPVTLLHALAALRPFSCLLSSPAKPVKHGSCGILTGHQHVKGRGAFGRASLQFGKAFWIHAPGPSLGPVYGLFSSWFLHTVQEGCLTSPFARCRDTQATHHPVTIILHRCMATLDWIVLAGTEPAILGLLTVGTYFLPAVYSWSWYTSCPSPYHE